MATYFALSLLIASICLVLGLAVGYECKARRIAKLEKDLAVLQQKYLHVVGWHLWFGTYDLESFDGGKSWYAMADTEYGARLVRGNARDIFPGLLEEPGIWNSSRKERHSAKSKEQSQRSVATRVKSFNSCEQSQSEDRSVIRELVRKQSICMKMQILTHGKGWAISEV